MLAFKLGLSEAETAVKKTMKKTKTWVRSKSNEEERGVAKVSKLTMWELNQNLEVEAVNEWVVVVVVVFLRAETKCCLFLNSRF